MWKDALSDFSQVLLSTLLRKNTREMECCSLMPFITGSPLLYYLFWNPSPRRSGSAKASWSKIWLRAKSWLPLALIQIEYDTFRAVAAPHTFQQSRFYLRKSTYFSARRNGGVPRLLLMSPGSLSSRPGRVPHFRHRSLRLHRASASLVDARWMHRPLRSEGFPLNHITVGNCQWKGQSREVAKQ